MDSREIGEKLGATRSVKLLKKPNGGFFGALSVVADIFGPVQIEQQPVISSTDEQETIK